MSELCVCKRTGNTGIALCQGLVKDADGIIFQPIRKANGTLNYIDLATLPITGTVMTGWVNAADKLARMYPTGQINDFVSERDDPTIQEGNNGNKQYVSQGARNILFSIWGVGAALEAQYENFMSLEMGFYIVSKQDAVTGLVRKGDKTKVYPIPLQALFTKQIFGGGDIGAGLNISFDMNIKNKDSELITVSSEAFEESPSELRGLITFNLSVIEATPTALVVEFVSDQGYANCLFKATGLVAGDMTLLNVTDESAIAITGVTEDEGQYTITWDGGDNPTVADVLQLTVEKDGGDYSSVPDTEITVTSGS